MSRCITFRAAAGPPRLESSRSSGFEEVSTAGEVHDGVTLGPPAVLEERGRAGGAGRAGRPVLLAGAAPAGGGGGARRAGDGEAPAGDRAPGAAHRGHAPRAAPRGEDRKSTRL